MSRLNITSIPSPNYNERRNNAVIDMLVIHYTGMPTANDALVRMCSKEAEVSSHYMIDENGRIIQLVDEKNRAWHAGIAFWKGITDINSASIGIELVNKGHEFGYHPFSNQQMESLIKLCQDILTRHQIPKYNIVGHSDVAPSRKTDPGELFNWQLLAQNGIGLWTDNIKTDKTITIDDASSLLSHIGYETSNLDDAVTAFKRHFMPWKTIDATIDDETICRIHQISCLI